MELLKQIVSFNQDKCKPDNNEITKIQRKQIIQTMLYMMDHFAFCSISSQIALTILDTVKVDFDKDDITTLKKFVYNAIKYNKDLSFESGRSTSNTNMAQVIRIGFELKKMAEME